MIDDESKSQYTSFSLAGVEKRIILEGDTLTGYMQKLPYEEMKRVIDYGNYRNYQGREDGERTEHDTLRFAGLKSVSAHIRLQVEHVKNISNHLIGVFFEDLNYAADGGLYAELIQNRDFEYSPADGNKDKNWNSTYAWSMVGEGTTFSIGEDAPVHANNRHHALLDVLRPGASLVNSGFDGICIKKGEKYDFSIFAKAIEGKGGKIKISLLDKNGEELAQASIPATSGTWKKQNAVLTASVDAEDAVLAVSPQKPGKYALDMISLFPRKTFKGRKNGLRADLAQAIADLHPRFMRFPGGCLAHGDGVDNIYDWKGSIGALEARKPLPNIWRYHQTRGLGYYEYFLFCEDIGAEPIPVVAAGVPCQNSGTSSRHSKDEITSEGQQGGIPIEEMGQYIQDILDLIEYANGDARKTKWGKIRAQSGHPEPFNLKYIGIGNEDLISEAFEERFIMIYNAVKEKYPEITIIGTVGPACEGTDYEIGWDLAKKLEIPIVDEHYYRSPGWFIHHQDFYDNYDRNKSKVYLGEYAAHLKNGPNVETALAEALYLTAIERNADVVSMASYAPLLAKEGRTQWNPDLIYFNNTEVKPTVGYYVQQMYSLNSGDEYIPSVVTLDNSQDAVKKRIAVSVVRDSGSGDMIIKLVNMLPVNVKTQIVLPAFNGMCTQAATTVLGGNPRDKQALPVSGTIDVGENFPYEIPAYSFAVIRIEKVEE
jgi:carbohydrate binding domain protein